MTKPKMPPSQRVQESWRRHARYEFLLETGGLSMGAFNRQMVHRRQEALEKEKEVA